MSNVTAGEARKNSFSYRVGAKFRDKEVIKPHHSFRVSLLFSHDLSPLLSPKKNFPKRKINVRGEEIREARAQPLFFLLNANLCLFSPNVNCGCTRLNPQSGREKNTDNIRQNIIHGRHFFWPVIKKKDRHKTHIFFSYPPAALLPLFRV